MLNKLKLLALVLLSLAVKCVLLVAQLVVAVLGRPRWQPPRWLNWCARTLRRIAGNLAAGMRAQPHRAAVIAGLITVVVGGSFAAWNWYQHRPKPVEIAFTLEAPGRTCIECEPPGKPHPLTVRFASSVAPLEVVNKELAGETLAGVSLDPGIEGSWRWSDDKTLTFQPAADWPIGERHQLRFARKGFVASHVRLKDYQAEFATVPFSANIAKTEFHQDPVQAADKKAVITVNFAYPVEPAEFERRVELRMFNRLTDEQEEDLGPAPFSVVYDKLKLNAYIHSGKLQTPDKSGRLALTIERGLRAAGGGNVTDAELKAEVAIPGLNSLRVQSLALTLARDERGDPQQVLTVEASYSVRERELPGKLKAWLLPLVHPDAKTQAEFEKHNAGQPYPWHGNTVTPQVLAVAEPLAMTPIPGELEHAELHSFRHAAHPGRYVYVKIEQGLQSFGGYRLGKAADRVLTVPEYPKEVHIIHQGALLALGGTKKLNVLTRDLQALRVEVSRLLPRQLQHLVTQSSGMFAQPQFNYSFDEGNVSERLSQVIRLPELPRGSAHYEALDLGQFLKSDGAIPRGIFFLRLQAWDAQKNVPQYDGCESACEETRLLVLTDLGLLAKRTLDGSQDVFVQSIENGTPLAGVTVDVIGKNGEAVLTQLTDQNGHARFADLKSFEREQTPVLYLARKDGDSSFLPLDGRVRPLDLSRFDVGGAANTTDPGALTAYLFSDRGLYKPGDEVRVGAIVRSQDWARSLQGVPLRLEIIDPRGVRLRRETLVLGAAGFADIRFQTQDVSPTGNYTISLSIVKNEYQASLIGSVTVQVRDFQPDRLRMTARFSAESPEGWVSPDQLKAKLALQNLFGTPAQHRRVTAEMVLAPSFPSFRAFPDYRFTDPQAAKEGFRESLPETRTSDGGEAEFDLNLQRFARATYRVHLVAQGFEADGGRGVAAEAAQLVSSMPFLVGYKPDGDYSYVTRGSQRTVHLLAIDPRAKPTAAGGLKLARVEVQYVSTLIKQNNGTFKYESRRKETVHDEQEFQIPAEGVTLPLDTTSPGSFAYVLRDSAAQQLARVDFQVAGAANLARSLEKNAELQITLDKKDYAPGESIEMQIQAPYTGTGLITIERDRLYVWKWFRTTTTSSLQSITVPEGVEGNAYVSVSFVRDLQSDEIYTSPLSYGIQPFSVALDARRNPITLEAPALVKPGDTLKLRYATRQPSRVVVFAVDEGILQVARYKVADPLGHFFQKRSLDVSTRQILDLILPEFRLMNPGAAPGGDMEGALGKHLNPFKRKGDQPVAWWSGILDADATPRTLEYRVPDYFNGSLRLMAVAVADDSVGVYDGKTLVRGDFVLSPNAPTTVTPGDEFEVSVGVANNVAGSGANAQVAVTLRTGAGLEVSGVAEQALTIAESGEGSARFRLKANDVLGAAELMFSARSGEASADRRIDLSVRPATPYMTQLVAGSFGRGGQDVPVARNLYPQYRTLEAGVSVLPLALAHGLSSYLGNYPYACTEQLMSMAMPAVVLGQRPEFGYVKAQKGASLPALIGELRSRQNGDGAYRLWAGGSEVAEFVSVYAQHFLLEAAERGQIVPKDLLERGNDHLRQLAARDGNNLNDERDSAYALYLLTRQGHVMAAEASRLRQRLEGRYKDQWEKDTVAAWLAAALKLLKEDGEASKLIKRVVFVDGDQSHDLYHDPMTSDGALLYLLARHFPDRLQKLPPTVMDNLVKRIQSGHYHSLSAATTILALDAYASAAGDVSGKLSVTEVLGDGKTRALTLPPGLLPKLAFSEDAAKLRFENKSDLGAYYLVNSSGFDRMTPTAAIANGFEIIHEYTDAEGKPLQQVKLGEEVTVHLKFRSLKQSWIPSVALVDLLPGGFELVVPPQDLQQARHVAAADDTGGEAEEGEGENEVSSSAAYAGWNCVICVTGTSASPHYADLREDRVVFYVGVSPEITEIVYRIKATNIGAYTVPPAYGEAMYDRQLQARSAGGRLTVVPP